jgi:hypothetical protein
MSTKLGHILYSTLGIALLLALTACDAELSYAYMSKDSGGNFKTTKFLSVGDEIHCVMEVIGGDEETVLVFGITAPDGVGLSQNDFYPRPDPKETGPVQVDIQLYSVDNMGMQSNKGPWPIGPYLMDVYLDGDLTESLPFDVVQ